jgi:hypothetical protein
MLKYKLNLKNKQDKIIKVDCESLYFSSDCTYITGVTDISYNLSNKNTIIVASNEENECSLEATDVVRCGYVIYNKSYEIQVFDEYDTIGILYNDGQYYCINYSDITTNLSDNLTDNIKINIIVNNNEYQIGEINKNTKKFKKFDNVIIPTKYWVYDNKVIIDDITYYVDIDHKTKLLNDDNYYPYIVLRDTNNADDINRVLYVIDWEHSKRKLVTTFKITSKVNLYLDVKKNQCNEQIPFFYIDNKKESKIYLTDYTNQMDFYNYVAQNNKEINYEWKNVEDGGIITIYLNDNYDLSFFGNIYVSEITNLPYTLYGEDNEEDTKIIFYYHDVIYECNKDISKDYVLIGNTEYEIFNIIKRINDNDIPYNYIIYNDMPLSIEYTDNNKIKMKSLYEGDSNEFDVIKHYMIEIDDILYKIESFNENGKTKYFIKLDKLPEIQLSIFEYLNKSTIRCILNSSNLKSLVKELIINPKNFIYNFRLPLFDSTIISPNTKETKDYISSKLEFYTKNSSFSIPIKLENDNSIDLHKEFLLKNNYVNDIVNNSINRIVDMEKDVYYPAVLVKKNQKEVLNLCNKIQIDLHFRSRDLKTWTINETTNDYRFKHPTNWNIFDSYRYNSDNDTYNVLKPVLSLTDELKYYPPSDLLYFLNFTNEDVFYQKQKIGKSFLRLSFYDSMDPSNQSLLYTTTVFMSETTLFKKYINADKTKTTYITVKDRSKEKEINTPINNDYNDVIKQITYSIDDLNIVNNIGVHTEPCVSSNNKKLLFDEEKRLSSSFIIKSKNETIDSSDGFYLYLFKEYSNWLHERTIYMKVQFNHAGLGKTVNFMMLYHKNSSGNKSMINWSSKYNFDKYKDGCSLKELYEHIYIEIKVKYDLENKRFCYYLPEWMSEKNTNKNVMHLSLFEIKIKDESNL